MNKKIKNMNTKHILLAVACAGLATSLHANTVTFDSTVFGTGDLGGPSETFNSGGVSLTIATTDGTTHLYGKVTSGNPGETGLGINAGLDFEVTSGIGLNITVPTLGLVSLSFGSVQANENVKLTDSNGILGSGVTLSGDINSLASFNASSLPATDVITVFATGSATGADVLLDTVVANAPTVPDGGTTVALLGAALTMLGLVRRKLVA